MLYLNTKHIHQIGIDWKKLMCEIRNAVVLQDSGNYAQPIKPYLRFKNDKNRIIAMPAYVGGDYDVAGIKWISSFPNNIQRNMQRAHSVTILNDTDTGQPNVIFNTATISGIRTAAVTSLMIHEFLKVRNGSELKVGIAGFGPIGQLHLQMLMSLWAHTIKSVLLFDIKGIQNEKLLDNYNGIVQVARSFDEAYSDADIFITCTVSPKGYITQKPKDSSLLLNISLRDYTPEILDYTQSIVVDDWQEVCREQTDIERMHIERGLGEEQTRSLVDVVVRGAMKEFPPHQAVMFNPMGMAIFDIVIANYYYRQALLNDVGCHLDN